jgi:hypothetical protein
MQHGNSVFRHVDIDDWSGLEEKLKNCKFTNYKLQVYKITRIEEFK